MTNTQELNPSKSKHRSRLRIWLRRLTRGMILGVLICVLIICVGLVPVNNGFEPSKNGVEILVVSNEVHADVILPIRHGDIDWAEKFANVQVSGDVSDATHVAIGWGDKGFFIGTPTWSDLRLTTVTNALFWPSGSCLHIQYVKLENYRDRGRSVRLHADQYLSLVDYISQSFRTTEAGEVIQIEDAAYGSKDAFCEARGKYHMLNTCNSWVGRALKTAGVKVGLYTPLPKSVYLYLPNESSSGDTDSHD